MFCLKKQTEKLITLIIEIKIFWRQKPLQHYADIFESMRNYLIMKRFSTLNKPNSSPKGIP